MTDHEKMMRDLDRDFFWILCFPLILVFVLLSGACIYLRFIYEPPPIVEKEGIVTEVKIVKASSGNGNGKYKDKLEVRFDNGLYFSKSFNRSGGEPIEASVFKVGQKYVLLHHEGRTYVVGYTEIKNE